MSIAVVKGKVSQAGSEDLLTASVFGPLRYLPFDEYIKPILEQALNLNKDHLSLNNRDGSYELLFWPTSYRREPDMELNIGTQKIFIEVKFHSGKSGEKERDQLANQYEDLVGTGCINPVVIYLTKHRTMPTEELENSILSVKPPSLKNEFQDSLYWISWFDVWEFVHRKYKVVKTFPDQVILTDLNQLLSKQRLSHFTGMTIPSDLEITLPETNKVFYHEQRKRK